MLQLICISWQANTQLQTAVEHLLAQPARMVAIRQQLHVGQTVQYLDMRDNRMHAAKVIELKPDQLMVHGAHDGKYKWIRYAAVGLNPSVKVAQQPKEVLPPPCVNFRSASTRG